MLTGEIHILPTDNTPEFHFNSDGMFKIRGRGLYNNKTEDVEQVLNWITEYLENPVEVTRGHRFEYQKSQRWVLQIDARKPKEAPNEKQGPWFILRKMEKIYMKREYISTSRLQAHS